MTSLMKCPDIYTLSGNPSQFFECKKDIEEGVMKLGVRILKMCISFNLNIAAMDVV